MQGDLKPQYHDFCEACAGSGETCAACGNDDACDCDNRIEAECPECHGTGQNEDDEEEEE